MEGNGGTFRDRIGVNRRNSVFLILVFLVFAIVLGYVIGYAWIGDPVGALFGLAIAFALGTISGFVSYFAGDKMVLAASRAKEITHEDAPRLFNVVEEMTIAGGLPMPKVYIIQDSAPNAFATGRDPEHASVAVTTGLLDKLDREELQGVIGHEMSHIGNLDIRFTLLVGVLVGAIALLADWFLRFTFWGGGGRRDNDRGGGGGGGAAIFVLALVLAVVAPLIGRLVQAAVSRTRESLADATAVELTRNPIGLARALRTISDDAEVLEVANRATQHLYIVNPIKSFEERAKSLWDTHPPIGERVRALENIAGMMNVGPTV